MEVRLKAAEILYDLEKREAYLNLLLRSRLPSYNLSLKEKHFITELVYGVTRWKTTLDYIWSRFVKRDNLSLFGRILLRLVAYHIYFLKDTILPIAVNEIVEIAKRKVPKEAKLINAVSRRMVKERNNLDLNLIPFHIRYAIPEFIFEEWQDYIGKGEAVKILGWLNKAHNIAIRVNTLKISVEDLKEKLKERGIKFKDGNLVTQALLIEDGFDFEKSDLFHNGYFVIQSEASMLPALILNPEPGSRVIDLCSAPGLKSTHLAELMNNKGKIVSVDINKNRVKLVEENAKRLGISIIETLAEDVLNLPDSLNGTFDRVLLDAPCSGLGVISHKPEIKWRLKREDIYKLSEMQIKMLERAGKLLKKGGRMVYSTCTITWHENENVVLYFLERNPEFKLIDFFYKGEKFPGIMRVIPYKYKTDGFFISLIGRE
ncbi:16S rRNA (cytosine(967)-C(5))-methyltransferase RsmB [Dictyoglomus thermophilum]|uniref:16S rRNA (cytosine(967)-C(5))-methyltransferase n=2 Tax=Dictyoglomus thermophilum TaxID=14 RepID=B5YF43_DICT6|nr:16S rRNA (cytosine(967)-C(5))-methyltransferase RsmB [Dictyoglomus thermophilum]ACI19608.1 ribosomal RNA small subunit methyltransferase B [Dictyoglomus thermophilum H-6-12]MCX7719931.1 16S rRNA (cytosine(967)-C(5))-methyltransferase RsmB [Dictyoglomus thermophilum]TYT22621.1 16S rRNA (cytosine(967)-C(5))-methyltransferase RsmB [Dictyoglomus thermophilum]